MNKLIKLIQNPQKYLKFLCIVLLQNFGGLISDKTYLRGVYFILLGKKLDLDNPLSFNEKIQWLKLYDRKPIYTQMVDKILAKEYVADIIGEEYIIPTIATFNNAEQIDLEKLPNQFVLKCNHGCGDMCICSDKSKLDYVKVCAALREGQKRDYYKLWREWPYKNVKHRIICEEFMGGNLMDYKVMCFDGKVKYIFVCSERGSKDGLKVTFFDREWNKMPFTRHYPASYKKIEKPQNLEKMISLAERLSKDIPFVRVDFYEIGGKIYFGEMTFFPGAGYEEFTPEEWDYKLGELIRLPQTN